MSPLILDNLGIVVNAEQANARYAQSIGKSAAALSDQEKKQALVNAVIASSASLLKDNAAQGADMASSFERMDASLTNAKDALGVLFTPYAAAFANNLAEAVDHVTANLTEMA